MVRKKAHYFTKKEGFSNVDAGYYEADVFAEIMEIIFNVIDNVWKTDLLF
jgi:hypothetical protein